MDRRDPVADAIGIGQGLGDAASENVGIEHLGFGFEGEQAIELDDRGQIAAGRPRGSESGRAGSSAHGRSLRLMRARRLASWSTRSSSSVKPERPSRAILASTSSSRASSCSSGSTETDGDLRASRRRWPSNETGSATATGSARAGPG